MRSRWVTKAVGGLLLLVAALGGVAQADDPVTVVEYPDSNYEPGPGWPEGWTPPPVPREIPANLRSWLEDALVKYPEYTQWQVRVLEPLPKWTQEYPYEWRTDQVFCAGTIYVYWYPRPDSAYIYKTTGRSYAVARGANDLCVFEPVSSITEERRMSEGALASINRAVKLQEELDAAHPGLQRGYGGDQDGSPDNVVVFFNAGLASTTFDVPAYLDPKVARVRVPIRFVSELMGATVDWEERSGKITISFPEITRQVTVAVPAAGMQYTDIFEEWEYLPDPDRYQLVSQMVHRPAKSIVLTVGVSKAWIDGHEVFLDAPPVLRGERAMVPIRFIAEQIGAKVYWVGDSPVFRRSNGVVNGTYQVHIFTPFFPLYEYPSWYLEKFGVKV